MDDPSSWRFAAASAVGTSHVATGKPCQDSAASGTVSAVEGDFLVLVVCDGAGTAEYSDVGSKKAAQTFLELVEVYLDENGGIEGVDREVAGEWMERVAEILRAHAGDQGHSVRDYACTLLAAIVGERQAAFVQIGDGAIVVSNGPEDGWSYVFWPQHGEYANTTNFVVSPNALDVFDFELGPRRITEIAVFSDGIEKLVLHDATRTVHENFFKTMMPPVRTSEADGCDEKLSAALERYLGSPPVCARTDDDKTLILATRLMRESEDP